MTREGDTYLTTKQESTQKSLTEIMLGNKLYAKCSGVIATRQYKRLIVKDLFKFNTSKSICRITNIVKCITGNGCAT